MGNEDDNDVGSATGKDDDGDHIRKPYPGKFTKKTPRLPWSSPYDVLKVWNCCAARLVGVNRGICRSWHSSLPDLDGWLHFLHVGCHDNYDSVDMLPRCGCSYLWPDKIDKNYACSSHYMSVSLSLVMLSPMFHILYIS